MLNFLVQLSVSTSKGRQPLLLAYFLYKGVGFPGESTVQLLFSGKRVTGEQRAWNSSFSSGAPEQEGAAASSLLVTATRVLPGWSVLGRGSLHEVFFLLPSSFIYCGDVKSFHKRVHISFYICLKNACLLFLDLAEMLSTCLGQWNCSSKPFGFALMLL